jgi:hypothetical protein
VKSRQAQETIQTTRRHFLLTLNGFPETAENRILRLGIAFFSASEAYAEGTCGGTETMLPIRNIHCLPQFRHTVFTPQPSPAP